MKKLRWMLSIAGFGAIWTPIIFAQSVNLPELPDYYAYAPAEPSVSERAAKQFSWLKNFYISGEYGYSFADISGINNKSTSTGITMPLPAAVSKLHDNANLFGVALGYQLRQHGGLFSRIEIEYVNRGKIHYNVDPVLIFPPPFAPYITNKLTSTVKNQTLLGKIYYDIDLRLPIIPYIEAGAGISRNQTKTNGTFAILDEQPVISNIQRSNTHFAWDVGAGVRLKATQHIYLTVGYEFDWLGKVHWEMATGDPTTPIILGTNNFYTHNVIASLTLKA